MRPLFMRGRDLDRLCCHGQCDQGRACPLVPNRLPLDPRAPRRWAFPLFAFIAWGALVSAVALASSPAN